MQCFKGLDVNWFLVLCELNVSELIHKFFKVLGSNHCRVDVTFLADAHSGLLTIPFLHDRGAFLRVARRARLLPSTLTEQPEVGLSRHPWLRSRNFLAGVSLLLAFSWVAIFLSLTSIRLNGTSFYGLLPLWTTQQCVAHLKSICLSTTGLG